MSKPKDKIVYLVRHGQSEHNVAPVFQADDSPLSEDGRKQAEIMANRAKHLKFDVLLASPMTRAKQTAEIIAKSSGVEPEFNELFREADKPSSIAGKPYTDEVANRGWREWMKAQYSSGYGFEDSENYDDLVARTDKILDYLQNRKEQEIMLVAHGFILKSVIARVIAGDEMSGKFLRRFNWRTNIENTGLSILRFKDDFEQDHEWRLWVLNDHAHLAE